MKYFKIERDDKITNLIEPINLEYYPYNKIKTKEEFDKIADVSIGKFKNGLGVEAYDIYYDRYFFVSANVKKLLELYDEKMEFKSIQLFSDNLKETENYLYYMPYLEVLDIECKEKRRTIFRDKKLNIIVSLELAESLYRRNCGGVKFKELYLK